MKLSKLTIQINFAPLLKLFNKNERRKLLLSYYDFLNALYHANRRGNKNSRKL